MWLYCCLGPVISWRHPGAGLLFANGVKAVDPTFISGNYVPQQERLIPDMLQILLTDLDMPLLLLLGQQLWNVMSGNFAQAQVSAQNLVGTPHTDPGLKVNVSDCPAVAFAY